MKVEMKFLVKVGSNQSLEEVLTQSGLKKKFLRNKFVGDGVQIAYRHLAQFVSGHSVGWNMEQGENEYRATEIRIKTDNRRKMEAIFKSIGWYFPS